MDWWPCQLSILYRSSLVWEACGSRGLNSWTYSHHSVAEGKKQTKKKWCDNKKKIQAWHTEKLNFSFSSHSLPWTFCKCLILTVFDLALFLRRKKKKTNINLCIWRWQWWKDYCMTSLASHMWPLFQLTCELWYWRTKPIMYHL